MVYPLDRFELKINPVVKELLRRGVTKWRIHKFVKTDYSNVMNWARGIYQPSPKFLERLTELLSVIQLEQDRATALHPQED